MGDHFFFMKKQRFQFSKEFITCLRHDFIDVCVSMPNNNKLAMVPGSRMAAMLLWLTPLQGVSQRFNVGASLGRRRGGGTWPPAQFRMYTTAVSGGCNAI
jgi:hypothetical protein